METLIIAAKIVLVIVGIIIIASPLIAWYEVHQEMKNANNHNSDYSLINHDWKGFENDHLN